MSTQSPVVIRHQLILHPTLMDCQIIQTQLEKLLKEQGFIGKTFLFDNTQYFLVGEAFFEFVLFLGCSPVVHQNLPDNPHDPNFCAIDFLSSTTPLFLSSQPMKTPRCPHCRYEITNWQELINEWQSHSPPFICPQCHHSCSIPALNWRGKAGFSHFAIVVNGIFENEAVPTDKLLNLLQTQSNCSWTYFYRTIKETLTH